MKVHGKSCTRAILGEKSLSEQSRVHKYLYPRAHEALKATEKYYQVYTFENRGFNREEKVTSETALNLGTKAQEEMQGKPIDYYLEIWETVRTATLRLLKTKDDKWFASKVKHGNMNNH